MGYIQPNRSDNKTD